MEITQDNMNYIFKMFQQRDEIAGEVFTLHMNNDEHVMKIERLENLIEGIAKDAMHCTGNGCHCCIQDRILTFRNEELIKNG